jgi:hypothetical protein
MLPGMSRADSDEAYVIDVCDETRTPRRTAAIRWELP